MAITPKLSPSDPPPLDLGDELLAYAEQHPEENNYIEKTAAVAENYFQKPDPPSRPSSPITVKSSNYIPAHKYEIVLTKEQQLIREIGISVAEVKPLLKNAWQKCVLL